ncbi:MAG: hypothetical protein IPM29_07615 [Planctomycetes bacterium]|nr:hypothetical protein [Planctomycetota bacterium]
MKPRHHVCLWIAALAAPALAQGPVTESPAPADKPLTLAGASQSAMLADATEVWVDRPGDGRVWSAGHDWKASFGPRDWAFLPAVGADRPSVELRFALDELRIGGEPLPFRDGEIAVEGRRVTVDRDTVVETYDLEGRSVKQSFVLSTLPTRGEVTVRLDVTTGLQVRQDGAGLVFEDGDVRVAFRDAVARDASGAQVAMGVRCVDGQVELLVPADFVRGARLPLVVDPLLQSLTVHSDTLRVVSPDLSCDPVDGRYLMVWQRNFSATDRDLWGVFCDLGMTPVGSPFAIDLTTASWEQPRSAFKRLGQVHLITAQVSQNAASPYWVGGRLVRHDGTLSSAFDIARDPNGNYDRIVPDVGGDPGSSGSTVFAVVYERVISATDHDILLATVREDQTVTSDIPIDVALSRESAPRISKSNGVGAASTQRWLVSYQRTTSYSGGTEDDLRGAFLSPSGGVLSKFVIANTGDDERSSSPSSPSFADGNGQRTFVVAYERTPRGGGDSNIAAAVVRTDGTAPSAFDLQVMENAGNAAKLQRNAAADCDGWRFAVAYEEQFLVNSADWDVFASTLVYEPSTGQLALVEAHESLSFTFGEEIQPQLAASGAVGGPRLSFGFVLQDRPLYTDPRIVGGVYLGHAPVGGIATRATGCGNLTISHSGIPAAGRTLNVSVTGPVFLGGLLVGLPITLPLPTCIGCTLGVDGTWLQSPFSIVIPNDNSLIGATVAIQGVSLVGGTCLGAGQLSDTLDVTLQ